MSNLLAAVWRQLIKGKPIVSTSAVLRFHRAYLENGSKPEVAEIHQVLREAVAQWSRIYIVVDALDEVREHDRLLLFDHLTKLRSSTKLDLSVSLMVTSRPHGVSKPENITAVTVELRPLRKKGVNVTTGISQSMGGNLQLQSEMEKIFNGM
jgi:hypothetical protein